MSVCILLILFGLEKFRNKQFWKKNNSKKSLKDLNNCVTHAHDEWMGTFDFYIKKCAFIGITNWMHSHSQQCYKAFKICWSCLSINKLSFII